MLDKVPIVPRVYDFAQEGQRAYLAMEFIKGKDLLDLMEDAGNKPFPIPQVIEWGKLICDVLTYMHRQSPPLIHRDLKPDNIMLLEDKKSIKMIDFGTARDLGKTVKERAAGKTRVGMTDTAVPHREEGWNLLIPSVWLDPADTEKNVRWTKESHAAFAEHLVERRWLNYLVADLGDSAIREAYGGNWDRLVEVKRRYDPDNVFHLNQNIAP